MKAILFSGVVCLTIMFGFSVFTRGSDEVLVKEDSQVSATVLPLDLEISQTPYQTATFGMG